MILEQQVISLSLSKRLKELGVKQESIFYWNLWGDSSANLYVQYLGDKRPDTDMSEYAVSAFTVAELGEMYGGVDFKLEGGAEILMSAKYEGEWRCGLLLKDESPVLFNSNTEAEARGLMLEYLITNNLIAV